MRRPSLLDLRHRLAGLPAIVMGGGPSLPADLGHCPAGAVLISCNWRPAQLVTAQCAGRRCEFILSVDRLSRESDQLRPVAELTADLARWRLSPIDAESDVAFDGHLRMQPHSGAYAVVIADHLGCMPVILAGMDAYTGDRSYFDVAPAWRLASHCFGFKVAARAWREVLVKLNRPDCVRIVSGPLAEVFGLYHAEDWGLEAEPVLLSALPVAA